MYYKSLVDLLDKLPFKNGEIEAAGLILSKLVAEQEILFNRRNSQPLRLCIFQTVLNDIISTEMYTTTNPYKLIVDKNILSRLSRYYVTLPEKNTEFILSYLKSCFVAFKVTEDSFTLPAYQVINELEKKFGTSFTDYEFKVVNKNFNLKYAGLIYCSNGCTYKNLGSFAKAFGIKRTHALRMLNTGEIVKKVSISETLDSAKIQPQPFISKVVRRSYAAKDNTEDTSPAISAQD